jgi:hypothetical protein
MRTAAAITAVQRRQIVAPEFVVTGTGAGKIGAYRNVRAGQPGVEPWLSAKRAVEGDLVQCTLENGKLFIIELRDEQVRDPAQVNRRGLGQAG